MPRETQEAWLEKFTMTESSLTREIAWMCDWFAQLCIAHDREPNTWVNWMNDNWSAMRAIIRAGYEHTAGYRNGRGNAKAALSAALTTWLIESAP